MRKTKKDRNNDIKLNLEKKLKREKQ